jgi:hypothetical protein
LVALPNFFRFGGIASLQDVETSAFEDGGGELSNVLFILDHEN